MTHFFVDYENVTDTGLKGGKLLKKEDRVTVFYSVNAHKIDWAILKPLVDKGINIEIIEAETGYKNALDHQLASYLGAAIVQAKENEYCIVTCDLAFDAVIVMWRKRKVKIRRTSTIQDYYQLVQK